MNKAVFLDRDGVINKSVIENGTPRPPQDLENLEVLPGVEVALNELKKAGFLLIVVSNQPDVSRGRTTYQEVKRINDFLSNSLPIDAFFVCFHDNNDHCSCRKPKPGLIIEAAAHHVIDIKASFLVGDRWRDIAAGQAAGCVCYFIDYSYQEKSPLTPYKRVYSLLEASIDILGDRANANLK
jgi:D-glycero-D-manno-heptose 1,7-bisphosphate phosphatase